MSGDATVGDFWGQAADLLRPDPGMAPAPGSPWQVRATAAALYRLAATIARYLDDGLLAVLEDNPGPWGTALEEARRSAHKAAGALREDSPDAAAPVPVAGTLPDRLEQSARALVLARDLLHTHVASRPGGGWEHRSDWGSVVTSQAVARALLAGLAARARAAAGLGLALPEPVGGYPSGRRWRHIIAACRHLHALDAAVQVACLRDPVPEADRRLAEAIPVNALPGQATAAATATPAELAVAAVGAAERVRRAVWSESGRAQWAPDVNATSMRHAAASCVVAAHCCEVILRALGSAIVTSGEPRLRDELAGAAGGAAAARQAWLGAARAWDQLATDGDHRMSASAAAAADLALWTGRLAHADPGWTPARGPGRMPRPPGELAGDPVAMAAAVAAVHHVADVLTQLAAAGEDQLRAAAAAGRLYVPTRSLPERCDIPRRFGDAPASRVEPVVSLYEAAGAASARAAAAVAGVAETTGAYSQLLSAAAEATGHAGGLAPGRGLVQQALQLRGVTRPDLLLRAAVIDEATSDLLSDASTAGPPHWVRGIGSDVLSCSAADAEQEIGS